MTEAWRLILQSKESLHASDVAHEVNNKRKRNLASKRLKKQIKGAILTLPLQAIMITPQ